MNKNNRSTTFGSKDYTYQSSYLKKSTLSSDSQVYGGANYDVPQHNEQGTSSGSPYKDRGMSRYLTKNSSNSSFGQGAANSYKRNLDEKIGSPQTRVKFEGADSEAKIAIQEMEESCTMLPLVQDLIENYAVAQKKINSLDTVTVQSDVSCQALRICYQFIRKAMSAKDPNFDSSNMQAMVDSITSKVNDSNQNLQTYKGQFQGVHDSFVNQDMLGFRLQGVQNNKVEQDDIIRRMPNFENIVADLWAQVCQLKIQYQTFEQQIFSNVKADTKQLVQETRKLINLIKDTMEKISGDLTQAKQEMATFVPANQDQRDIKQNVLTTYAEIERSLKGQQSNLEAEIREMNKLEIRLQELENPNSVSTYELRGQNELTLMIAQSKKIHAVVEVRDSWQDLYNRLKQVIQEIDKLGVEMDRARDDATQQIDGILNAQNEEFDEVLDQINQLGEKISQDLADKERKLDALEKELLNDDLDDGQRADIEKKIAQYRDDISKAKKLRDATLKDAQKFVDESRNQVKDPKILYDLLQTLENQDNREVPAIQKKINELQRQANNSKKVTSPVDSLADMDDLRKKRGLAKGLLNDIKQGSNPEDDLEILGVIDYVQNKGDDKLYNDQIGQAQNDIDDDLKGFKDVTDSLPDDIAQLLGTLNEMLTGTEADPTADYYDQQDKLLDYSGNLKKMKREIDNLAKFCAKKKDKIELLKKNPSNLALPNQLQQLQDNMADLQEKANQAYDIKDEVGKIAKELGDFQIPLNIQKRGTELKQVKDRWSRINDDFKDMCKADQDFEGSTQSEKEIKEAILKIGTVLGVFDQEIQGLQNYQTGVLERYNQGDFKGPKRNDIIRDVRDHKYNIGDVDRRLKELEELLLDLGNQLNQQDIVNGSKLLAVKSKKLRDRLKAALKHLEKITDAGKQMDGNNSNNDEEEFVGMLTIQMPDILNVIDDTFSRLDVIDDLYQKILKTNSIPQIQQMKDQTDDAVRRVEQSESLVEKFEKAVVSWNSYQKLLRRDQELEILCENIKGFRSSLEDEVQIIMAAREEYQSRQDITNLKEIDQKIQAYINAIKELDDQVQDLQMKRDQCFQEFYIELPQHVQKESQTCNMFGFDRMKLDAKPNDIYYMIQVNCKYKPRIRLLMKQFQRIATNWKDLATKYGPLKETLLRKPNSQLKQPTNNGINGINGQNGQRNQNQDQIDNQFENALNRQRSSVPVTKLGSGKYMFGSKMILAKIVLGKLVIRVGGGYMSVEDFLNHYSKVEYQKIHWTQQMSKGRRPRKMRGSASISLAQGYQSEQFNQVREQMKESILRSSVKSYARQGYYREESPNNRRRTLSTFIEGPQDGVLTSNLQELAEVFEPIQFGSASKNQNSPSPKRLCTMTPRRQADLGQIEEYSPDQNTQVSMRSKMSNSNRKSQGMSKRSNAKSQGGYSRS